MKNIFYWLLVRPTEVLKKIFRCQTWHVETTFIFLVLAIVTIVTRRPWTEWLAVMAVTLTFCHASVANSLEEMEGERVRKGGVSTVECYHWLQRYFYGKEALWFVYFLLIHAYSALIGVIIFLFYGKWRQLWRAYHPITNE